MHNEYCEDKSHVTVDLCIRWTKKNQVRENGVDDETRLMFDWWCAQIAHSNSNLCVHWRWFISKPKLATPEEAAEHEKSKPANTPSEKDREAANRAFCSELAHSKINMCRNSPYTQEAKERMSKKGEEL